MFAGPAKPGTEARTSAARFAGPDLREARGASFPTISKSERGIRPGPQEPRAP